MKEEAEQARSKAVVEFKDKFIAFVDVLGFKKMVEEAERGVRTRQDLSEIIRTLGTEGDKQSVRRHGPTTCPRSYYVQRNLDFELTQVSDSVIVSSEVSPAGVINLVAHCWAAAINLLGRGVMVRGYVTRGPLHHVGDHFMGTGFHRAYTREKDVAAFKRTANDRGTPFIEVDAIVATYVAQQSDDCVRKMFARFTKTEQGTTALFPFQLLANSFLAAPRHPIDVVEQLRANDALRQGLSLMRERVLSYVAPDNDRALEQAKHYTAALDAQLKKCNETAALLDRLAGRG